MTLNELEMQQIKGGSVTAAFINAIVNGLESLFNLGKVVGKNMAYWLNKAC